MVRTLFFNWLFLRLSKSFKQTFIEATGYSIDTCNWLEYLLWSLEKRHIRLQHIKIFETVQKLNGKIISRESPEYNY